MKVLRVHPMSQHSGEYSLSSWPQDFLLKADVAPPLRKASQEEEARRNRKGLWRAASRAGDGAGQRPRPPAGPGPAESRRRGSTVAPLEVSGRGSLPGSPH